MCKSLGKGLDSMGVKMEGRCAVVEECRRLLVWFLIV